MFVRLSFFDLILDEIAGRSLTPFKLPLQRWDQQEEASTKRKSAMEKKDTARKKRRLSLDSGDNDLDLDFWELSFCSKRKKRNEDAEDERGRLRPVVLSRSSSFRVEGKE